MSWDWRPAALAFGLTPAFLDGWLRALAPEWLERSGMFGALADARLRWTPEDIYVDVGWHDGDDRSWQYADAIAQPGALDPAPFRSPSRRLDQQLRVALRPLASLTGGVELRSGRDLLGSADVPGGALQQQAVANERASLLGLDYGWERDRAVASRLEWRPTVSAWLQPSVRWSSTYRSSRTPSLLEVQVLGPDTLAAMRRGTGAERSVTRSVRIDPDALLRSLRRTSPGEAGPGGAAPGEAAPATGAPREAAPNAVALPVEASWTRSLASRFDRGSGAPSLARQLGWGGVDALDRIGGDTAAASLARDLFRVRGGVRLPLGAQLDAGYGSGSATVHNLGADRLQTERTWPDLRISWPVLPLPAALSDAIARAGVSTGYQWRVIHETLTGGAGELRSRTERGVPLELGLTFAGGVSASYAGQLASGWSSDATGDARTTTRDHALRMAGTFIAPAALRDRLGQPFRVELSFRQRSDRECRLRGAAADTGCVPYIDLVSRTLHLGLETALSQMNVGLQMSYDERRSTIGIRDGTSQLQLGLFGEFRLRSGEMPVAAPVPVRGGVR